MNMDLAVVATIARQELIVTIRNRWTVAFAVAFGGLVLAISYVGTVTAGSVGFQGFTRTSASLLNLVLYVVPLVALVMGTLSVTGDRAAREMLFAQPVTRTEVLLGKVAGLFCSLAAATCSGFGLAGLVIASRAGTADAIRYPVFVGLALALALVFLNIAALISALCPRTSKALGVALATWFFFVVLYDILAIGTTFLLGERAANTFVFASLAGNPVDLVRTASLVVLGGREILGAAGVALVRFTGGERAGFLALACALAAWTIVPLALARVALNRRDV